MKQIKTEPTIFVIFGGTGDLNARKITPALFHLYLDNWLPEKFKIIGSGRTKLTDEAFRSKLLVPDISGLAGLRDVTALSVERIGIRLWCGGAPCRAGRTCEIQCEKNAADHPATALGTR